MYDSCSDSEATCVGEKRKYDDEYSDDDDDESEGNSHTRHYSVPKTRLNTPLDIAYDSWCACWTIKEALRELISNMIDQARSVMIEKRLDGQIEIDEKPKSLIVRVGDKHLAEATWKVETCKIIREYSEVGKNKSRMAPGKLEYIKTQVIVLTNLESGLPWESFRPGMTTKGDDEVEAIGKYGEGLTAASVVLTRLGCNLSATCTRNWYETMVGKQDDDMVFFQIKRKKPSASANPGPAARRRRCSDQPPDSVRFRIVLNPEEGGLTIDVAALMAQIRLPAAVRATGIATPRGTLLLEDDYRGKQYNRTIFVSDNENCLFGYDFCDKSKNMLQGRDRNSMKPKRLLEECGAILSEAIIAAPKVCQRVLESLKYPAGYAPGESKDDLKRYVDLKEGEHLSPGALQVLRDAENCNQSSHLQQSLFCAHVPPALEAIVEHQGLRVVFTHPVLHNHETVVNNFFGALNLNGQALTAELRVGAHQHRIAELMGVSRVMRSNVPHVSGLCTFWRTGELLYVTSPEQLGPVSATGFTAAQEVSLYNTLFSCRAPKESVVLIMRLLREGHENDVCSDQAPFQEIFDFADIGLGGSEVSDSLWYDTDCSLTLNIGVDDQAARHASSSTCSATANAPPTTRHVPTEQRGVQTPPVLTQSTGVQTVSPSTVCVSTGTDPYEFVPPPPLTTHTSTQTDPEPAPTPPGDYVRHAASGVWLHGLNPQQQRDLAELIEDSVQTEEGQRRLRRLSGQLRLVASF